MLRTRLKLVARRYAHLSQMAPDLPPCYADPSVIGGLLAEMGEAPGVVAIDGGQLVGFWRAWQRGQYYGQAITYSPEYANAAEEEVSARVYGEMYAALAAQWTAAGYLAHYLTVLAHDRAGLEALAMLGFGQGNGDGIRDLRPVGPDAAGVDVRRAGPGDREEVLVLWRLLARHILAPPVFQPGGADFDPSRYGSWFDDPQRAVWIAERKGRPISFIAIQPAGDDACTVIRDEGTASITGAFTLEEERGAGVAGAVLDCAIAWAREQGYVRCSVDWETANLQANRFWPRHFTVICRSLGRRINPHALAVTPP